MADVSTTTYENTEEVLSSILEDGTCPCHPEQEINVFCHNDRTLMCLQCSLSHRGHNIETFVGIQEGEALVQKSLSRVTCAKHPEKDGLFFCTIDDAPNCEICCMTSCKNHQVIEIDDYLSEVKDQLLSLQKDLSVKQIKTEMLQRCTDEAVSLSSTLPAFSDAQIQKVQENFKEIRQALDKKETTALQEVQTGIAQMKTDLNSFVDSLNTLKDSQTILNSYLHKPRADILSLSQSGKLKMLSDLISAFTSDSVNQESLLEDLSLENCGVKLNIEAVQKVKVNFSGLNLLSGFGRNHRFMVTLSSSSPTITVVDIENGGTKSAKENMGNCHCAVETAIDKRGDIWIVGGHDTSGSNYTNKVYRYDPKKDVLEAKEGMPKANGYHALVSAPDGSLWVICGYSMSGTYRDVWRYSIAEDKWEVKPTMDVGLYYHTSAVHAIGNQYAVYVFGGWDERTYCNDIRVFNHNLQKSSYSTKHWEKVRYSGHWTFDYRTRAFPVGDGSKAVLVSASTSNCYVYDFFAEEISNIPGAAQLGWSYSAYWGSNKNETIFVTDTNSTVKYDALEGKLTQFKI
eukprot:CAMPEP_0114997116 /NCGR_PEP_ID=MMETSP0216-20121206/14715_1 /TAXON_ID=223996 /ORGANISM="Protocruzia adherens, Strain Boccale" /LENGTH=570 /DNA_ID=CAMNT_0002361451 /DNA_START=46 /DNA_END=1758 /DNA_ORIENTATION=+